MSKVLVELDEQGRLILSNLDRETIEKINLINKNNLKTESEALDNGTCGLVC